MAAPVFETVASAVSDNGTTSLTLPVPASTVDGDYLVAFVSSFSNRSISPPSGWTFLDGVNDAGVFLQSVAYVRVASSEPASYAWGLDLSRDMVGVCLRISGQHGTAPIAAKATQINSTSSTSMEAPSVSPSSEALLVTSHCTTFGSTTTFTPPGTMVERSDICSVNSPVSSPIAIEVNSETLSSGGATGTRTATASNSFKSVCMSVAIRPPGVPIGSPWALILMLHNA